VRETFKQKVADLLRFVEAEKTGAAVLIVGAQP